MLSYLQLHSRGWQFPRKSVQYQPIIYAHRVRRSCSDIEAGGDSYESVGGNDHVECVASLETAMLNA